MSPFIPWPGRPLQHVASLGIPAHRLGLTRTKVLDPAPTPGAGSTSTAPLPPPSCTLIEAFAAVFRDAASTAQGVSTCVHAAASAALCALFEVANPSPEQQLRAVADQLWHLTSGQAEAGLHHHRWARLQCPRDSCPVTRSRRLGVKSSCPAAWCPHCL